MTQCQQCNTPLSGDEIGLHLKLLDRQATTFLCRHCLAKQLHCDPAVLEEKILQFRAQGCVLFPEP